MNGKCDRCGTDNTEIKTFPQGEPNPPDKTHNLCVYCAAYGTTCMVVENHQWVNTGGAGLARMFHVQNYINYERYVHLVKLIEQTYKMASM